MDNNGFLLACAVWDWGTMPVLRGPEGGGCSFLEYLLLLSVEHLNFRQVADRGGLVTKLDDSYSRT